MRETQSKESVVLSYTNPDLDGVACAIAIARLRPDGWQARISGKLDAETTLVLQYLDISQPPIIAAWSEVERIWLVDTHHIRQLPSDMPLPRVVKVTDHHPAGDVDKFANALVQNESVGAAATLVAESFLSGDGLPQDIAILLQCAIISNTLDFQAASTCERDRRAYNALRRIAQIPEALLTAMHEGRRLILEQSSYSLLIGDMKMFSTPRGLVAICQVEAPGALSVLKRSDLKETLRRVQRKANAISILLNLVDTKEGASAVVGLGDEVEEILRKHLSPNVVEDSIIRVGRVLQRKSDIVPVLMGP